VRLPVVDSAASDALLGGGPMWRRGWRSRHPKHGARFTSGLRRPRDDVQSKGGRWCEKARGERLGKMRLDTGKYLHIDAALAEGIRMTPGHTMLLVGFTVAARGGLGVWPEGACARLECSGRLHGHVGGEVEWPGGPG
jgi:hypothetical protein